MCKKIYSVLKEDKGQGMVEYGLIIALVSIAVIAIITSLGGSLKSIFTKVDTILKGVNI